MLDSKDDALKLQKLKEYLDLKSKLEELKKCFLDQLNVFSDGEASVFRVPNLPDLSNAAGGVAERI